MTSTALPTAAANPTSVLTERVRRIDPDLLIAVAQSIDADEQAMVEQAEAQVAGQQTALQAQQAEQQAAFAAQQQAATPRPQVQTSTPATSTGAATAATSTQTSRGTSAVAIPASQYAPRTQHDYWTKHMAQFAGKYLPDGPSMRPNCGPASVTMALRMVGLDVPGFNGQNSEAVLDKARVIATGKNDVTVGTTDSELERLISASGAKWSESTNFNQVTDWVKQGIPVVLSGNPAHGWNDRYSNDEVYKFD
ncbi:MAG: hypothetical protein ABI200_00245, partial [Gaiellales bacterium]